MEDAIKFRTKANKDGTKSLQYSCLKVKIISYWDENDYEVTEISNHGWSDWQDIPSFN